MKYLMLFLEGFITFISPCILPMLPIYFSYLAGEAGNDSNSRLGKFKLIVNSLGFIFGFTIIFVALGAFSGSLGQLVVQNIRMVNIIAGLVMILFGLNFIGIIRIGFLNKNISFGKLKDKMGFFASLIFGLTFGISFSPCVGAFLGSALALAASEGSAISGIFMLLTYSLGLGIPFLISAILVDQFQSSFNFIRKHQKKINLFSGIFLILMGIITALGIFNDFAGLFL
jgi:cytochrome c-type biogenesis protein